VKNFSSDVPGNISGLLIFEDDVVLKRKPPTPLHLVYLNARPRKGRDPFVVMTALLRRAAEFSPHSLVIVFNYALLRRELGIFQRMADRVVMKYGGLFANDVDWFGQPQLILNALRCYRSIQYPPALQPTVKNICGHAGYAQFLFVGEEINPVYRRFEHWPFHANSGCTVFLTQCLEKIKFSEELAMWTNILHKECHAAEIVKFQPDIRVVALGKHAVRGLKKQGVKIYAELPHPQFAKRFLSKKLDYAEKIREIVSS
jgi:hypothetical protein